MSSEEATQSSYTFPSASEKVEQNQLQPHQGQEQELELRQSQYDSIRDALETLNAYNPMVVVNLDHPLDRQLHNELVKQGYQVSSNYSYRTVNGHETSSSTVTVALPQAKNHILSEWSRGTLHWGDRVLLECSPQFNKWWLSELLKLGY